MFVHGLGNVQADKLWGAINKNGEIIIPPNYNMLGYLSHNMISACQYIDNIHAERCGYIDKHGDTVIPFKFLWADDFSEGIGAAQGSDTKWFYINDKGERLFNKSYSITSAFSEGLAEVCVNYTKCGFIDKKGNPVIDLKYTSTSSFDDGLAAVLLDGKWGFIDKKGKKVIPFIYNKTGMVF